LDGEQEIFDKHYYNKVLSMSDLPSMDQPELSDEEICEHSISETEIQIESSSSEEEGLQNEDVTATASSEEEVRGSTHKQTYDGFLAAQQELQDPEQKLQHAVDFMETTLSTKQGTPHFKSFWDARNVALNLFKENVNAPSRTELWARYASLSKEARRLKEILDEQSAFASEQIEIAIHAIEVEQESPQPRAEDAVFSELLQHCQTLAPEEKYYSTLQSELSRLNAHAGRVTALRKELIRTEMRVRQKNKFFQRLSLIGDKVFPRRKELIKEISQRFSADVDAFVEQHFSTEDFRESLFFLREEIKALQSIAKQITLNTHSFKYTRMRLSECWDKLKHLDKERKRVRAQQKATSRQNAEPFQQQLAELAEIVATGEYSQAEVQQRLDDIIHEIQSSELGRDELKILREDVGAIRKPMIDRLKAEEQERMSQILEKDKLKRSKIQDVKDTIQAMMKNLDDYDAETLTAARDAVVVRIGELTISKLEKQDFERSLKPLKDAIVDKKEKSLMALSEDDRNILQQLKEILKQRKERRQEIKAQLEVYRKSAVSSGLDLERAMYFSEQITAEKERLDKVSQGIKEIEEKIALVEKKA